MNRFSLICAFESRWDKALGLPKQTLVGMKRKIEFLEVASELNRTAERELLITREENEKLLRLPSRINQGIASELNYQFQLRTTTAALNKNTCHNCEVVV